LYRCLGVRPAPRGHQVQRPWLEQWRGGFMIATGGFQIVLILAAARLLALPTGKYFFFLFFFRKKPAPPFFETVQEGCLPPFGSRCARRDDMAGDRLEFPFHGGPVLHHRIRHTSPAGLSSAQSPWPRGNRVNAGLQHGGQLRNAYGDPAL